MKLYEIVLKPRGPFGTLIKGDTLFGHFCWQARYDGSLLRGGLDHWIERYPEQPFAIFSSAWPRIPADEPCYALKRPDVPMQWLFPTKGDRATIIRDRKKNAARKWLIVANDLFIDLNERNIVDEKELARLSGQEWSIEVRRAMRGKEKPQVAIHLTQPHNTIDRRTMTTGTGMFAPYVMPVTFFSPGMEWAVFVLIDEAASDMDRIRTGLERIGRLGFGRDASAGLGRFDIDKVEEKPYVAAPGANALYAMAPSVPERHAYRDCLFSPFTRFGKHGDFLATSANPFKSPVIMADEGAVFIPEDKDALRKPYIGRAVQGISKCEPRAVAQGYAPVIPFKLENMP